MKKHNNAGVYKIECAINKKVYIGSTLNYRNRCKNHLSKLRNNVHANPNLQDDFNKYGEENFTFSLLEECSDPGLLQKREYDFMCKYKSMYIQYGYNIMVPGDTQSLPYYEHRNLMKQNRKPIIEIDFNSGNITRYGCASEILRIYKISQPRLRAILRFWRELNYYPKHARKQWKQKTFVHAENYDPNFDYRECASALRYRYCKYPSSNIINLHEPCVSSQKLPLYVPLEQQDNKDVTIIQLSVLHFKHVHDSDHRSNNFDQHNQRA